MTTKLVTVTLETPIVRGDTTIAKLQLRKPNAGELRGLSLAELSMLKTDAVITVLPRITIPPITEVEASALESDDLLQVSLEIADFLLTAKARAAATPTT